MGKKVTLGLIGLGARGIGLLKTVFLHHEDVDFAIVCDVYEDRCQEAAEIIEKSRPSPPPDHIGLSETFLKMENGRCSDPLHLLGKSSEPCH